MRHAVRMASTEGLIEGLAIPFGGPWLGADGQGRDLYGQFFSAKTELCLDWFDSRPLLYQHGFDDRAGTEVVGRVASHEVRSDGVWVQAQLDASSEYFSALTELIEKGKLYFSSGSVEHLFEAAKNGEILRWPWVELSLTPNPANLFATIDQPTAEKHWEAAGLAVKSLLDRLPATPAPAVRDLPTEPTPIDGEGWGAPAGSYEHLRESLQRLARMALRVDPYGYDYCWVVLTFPGYCVVGVDDADGPEFFEVAYTVGEDGAPVLGEIRQVQRVYLPIPPAPADAAPTAVLAAHTIRSATALKGRVSALHESRVREGRVLSTANRARLQSARDAMQATLTEFETLLAETAPASAAEAGAARALIEVQAAHARSIALACGLE